MAGTYTDIPGTRFALDQDGTVAKWRNYTGNTAWADVSASLAQTQTITTSTYLQTTATLDSTSYVQFAFAFPEARSISGVYVHMGYNNVSYGSQNLTWEYSTDTLDGTDGTWSSFTASFSYLAYHNVITLNSKPYYRSDIAPLTLSNVKGIRVRYNWAGGGGLAAAIFTFHLYGTRPTSSVHRLAFWHPTLDQALSVAALDFGDIPQGGSSTRQFRLKNISGSQTANSVSVAVSDLLPEYPTNEMQVSADNTTYANSASAGTINAGSISSIMYVKRVVGASETVTVRHARLLANATSWT